MWLDGHMTTEDAIWRSMLDPDPSVRLWGMVLADLHEKAKNPSNYIFTANIW